MDILKQVVQGCPDPTASEWLEDSMDDQGKESEKSTSSVETQDEEASIILGLTAAPIGLNVPFTPWASNKEPESSITDENNNTNNIDIAILGLSAAGLNAPFTPAPAEDLKLLKVRTTGALRCLRRHLLPASRTR